MRNPLNSKQREAKVNKRRHFYTVLLALCIALLYLVLLLLYWNGGVAVFVSLQPAEEGEELTPEQRPPSTAQLPLVLAWTKFFGNPLMHSLMTGNKYSGKLGTDQIEPNDVSQCTYKCEYSDDRSRLSEASVLVFHMRDSLNPFPPVRALSQLYVFFLLESPANTGREIFMLPPGFFNATMSYRADSDIHYPYDGFEPLGREDAKPGDRWTEEEFTFDQIAAKVDGKTGLALQIVSNCNTAPSGRNALTSQLKNHIPVDVFGSCGNRSCDQNCFQQQMDSHFFYLAFENSVCLNYVTEKFWNLKRLIVPVVLSRRVFAGLTGVPNNTFIAADDFDSAEQLAEHLKMVAANRTEYMKYFEWTRHYKRPHVGQGPNNPLCRLCEFAVHHPPKQRSIDNIVHYWRTGGRCQHEFVQNALYPEKTQTFKRNKINLLP